MKRIHYQIENKLLMGLLLVLMSFGSYAQTTVPVPAACTDCGSGTACTAPTALVCEAAATVSAGGSLTSTVTGGTGGSITWAISPTTGVSTTGGSGASTGAITFAATGTYTLTFTSTNNSTPAACSPAASVTCTRSITVNAAPVGSLTGGFICEKSYPYPLTYQPNGTAYSGKATLSYTGGNGGAYAAGSVSSTGVTGFTASWAAGTLANGAGSIDISVTGSSTIRGMVVFPITIAGQSCTIKLGTCGAYIAPDVWKVFLCHNLGADITADPHNPSGANTDAWKLNGAYVQWGRRGPNTTGDSQTDWQTAADNSTLGFVAPPTATNSNAGAVTVNTWSPQDSTLWKAPDGSKGIADPCPAGYRVPDIQEWVGVFKHNVITRTGDYIWYPSSNTKYNNMINFGPSTSEKTLTLPAAGNFVNTATNPLLNRGQVGYYHARNLAWNGTAGQTTSYRIEMHRNEGIFGAYNLYIINIRTNDYNSVRCIAE